MKFPILLLGSCLVCVCLSETVENSTSSPDSARTTTMEDQTTTLVTDQPDVSLNFSILPLAVKMAISKESETTTGRIMEPDSGATRWSILSSGATMLPSADTTTSPASVSSSTTNIASSSSFAMIAHSESSSSTQASSADASSTSASSSSSASSESSTASSPASEAMISTASVAPLGNSVSSVDASSSTSASSESTSASPENGSPSSSSSTSASALNGENAASASTQAQEGSSAGSGESAMPSSTPASMSASADVMALADSLYEKCVGAKKSAMCYGDKKNCFRDKNCTFLGVVEDHESMVNVSILARSFDPASDTLGLTVKFNRHIKEQNDSIKCDPISFKSLQISYRARSKTMMSEMPHYANAVIEKAKLKADCEDGVKNMTLKPKETFGYKLALSKNDSHALVPQGLVRVSEAPAARNARKLNPESAPLVPDPAEAVFQKCLADKSHCFVDEATCDLRKSCKTIIVVEEQMNDSRFSVLVASKTASVNDVQFAGSLKNGSRSCLDSLRNDIRPFISSLHHNEPKEDKLQVTNATVYRCDDSTVITNANNATTDVFFKVYGKLLEVAEDPKPSNGTANAVNKRTPLSEWKPTEAPNPPAHSPTSAGQYLVPTVYNVITIVLLSLMV